MEKKRICCAITSLHGKVYAVGGDDGQKNLSSGEMFDPATNKWTPIPGMKEARMECAACSIGNFGYINATNGPISRIIKELENAFFDED